MIGNRVEGWKPCTLKEFATVTTGTKDVNEGNPRGKYPFFTCARALSYSDVYSFDGEAILVAGNGAGVGNLHFYNGKFEAYQRTYVVREISCNPRYLWHAMDFGLRKSIGLETIGTSIPYIKMENITEFEFQIPESFEEQSKIASALDDADSLLVSLEALIAKKRDIKQGAMQRLLTGRTRLPGFSEKWKRFRLDELGNITGAGVDKKIVINENPVTLLNYLDVYRRNFIFPSDLNHRVTCSHAQAISCNIRSGDVFFTPTSETPDDIGKSAVAVEDIPNAVYSYHTVRLRFSIPMDINFSSFIFDSSDFRSQTLRAAEGSGTRYVITLPRFRSLTVEVPPLDEQKAIGNVLFELHSEIEALIARRDKTALIKKGMMQELLTGRTRLL
jgi:type I restriction enzyme, S subunit